MFLNHSRSQALYLFHNCRFEQIDRYGHTRTMEHPTVKTKMQYMNLFKNLSTQLGLSPSSRAQLAGIQIQAKEESEDPLLQLLKAHS